MMADSPTSTSPDTAAHESIAVPAITLPKAGGAIRGIGEKFTTNPATGTGSLSVPIAVSPGRSGFGPRLSLSYDTGRGNGLFGFGWDLSLPAITRRTDKGLPRYADSEESDVFLLAGVEDLVPVLEYAANEGWQRVPLVDPPHAPGYRIDRYRPRTEGLFARIERWTRLGDGDVHWRSVTPDNVTTWYGGDTSSRIADPNDPTRVFKWLICRSHDDKGNAISYEYLPEDGKGVDLTAAHERHRRVADRQVNRHLKRIKYGNRNSVLTNPDPSTPDWMFEVVFDYGEHDPQTPSPSAEGEWLCRADPFSSYRAGFETRTYRLCQRALMFHHFPSEPGVGAGCLVRSTEFAYQPGEAVGSFLTSVTQRGYRRTGNGYVARAMPPVEFTYSPATLHSEVVEVDSASLANLPAGLAGTGYQWADLDGEGISGILAEQAGSWYFTPNLGEGEFGAVRPVRTQPSLVGAPAARTQLMDLAGDGQLDVVAFSGPNPGFYERTEDGDWAPLRDFPALPDIDWTDPNLRFVDLDGDGHADVLITEQEALTWYPSRAEDGFGPAQRVAIPPDEDRGPRLVFADGTESIHLADLSGDGLTDLVRIRNGEVCYWPNLGYGRFGRMVTMDDAPWFDRTELFDQRYLLLADVDGSGVTDMIYLTADGARIYLNRSGNGWSPPQHLRALPGVDNHATVHAVDLLGNGTTTLVWSSDRPGDERRSLRYVDLLGGTHPHLLVGVDNNLGSQVHIRYATSTAFYLADKAAGRPWLTRLPFPVQVVERIETYDRISRNRFVSRYVYHHGYFDGVEREFRGFAMVEQTDTEELAALAAVPGVTNTDPISHVPPVKTKTWFHNGAFADSVVSRQFADEYWYEPAMTAAEQAAMLLDDTVLPTGIRLANSTTLSYEPSPDDLREACRALRGMPLRQEIYALDGSEHQDRPYVVSESNHTIEILQPHVGNQHAVCFTHPRETLTAHYERRLYDIERSAGIVERLADPRVIHNLTMDVDAWGNVVRSAAIAYGRRHPTADLDPRLPASVRDALHEQQTTMHATLTVNRYTDPIDAGPDYRAPLPCESRTYELVQVAPATSQPGGTSLMRFDHLRDAADAAADGSHDLSYEDTWAEGAVQNHPYQRLIEHTRTLYRSDDLTGPLPLGTAGHLALPFETYQLAFTPGLLAQVYQRGAQDLLPNPAAVVAEGGYVLNGGQWWVPSGQIFYSPSEGDSAAQEFAHAEAHFFLPYRFQDPFGQTVAVGYDAHGLQVVHTHNPMGNTVLADNDYRVLAPWRVTDPNGNRTEALIDALGLVVATAVRGKASEQLGDLLDGLDPDPADNVVLAHFADPFADPQLTLGRATVRLLYDLFAFARSKNTPEPQPPVVCTIGRETHSSDLPAGKQSRLLQSFAYSDGFGRVIQSKIQAEPGSLTPGGPQLNVRWVGSGWTIFNNKGNPVRQYEPFFAATHHFEFAKTVGVSPVLCYDPTGRVVATLAPDDTYARVDVDPWQQATWDGNDTVLLDPRTDPEVQGLLAAYLATLPNWQTWHQRRANGGLGPREQAAATDTKLHAATPTRAYADTLGRAVLTVVHNRRLDQGQVVEHLYPTRVVLDIKGNQRAVIDARGVYVLRQTFDMAGRVLYTTSPDAGQRWVMPDIGGKPIRRWNSRGHTLRHTYDAVRRPIGLWVRDPAAVGETLAELAVYGESHPQASERNLRGRLHRQYDGAGLSIAQRHDFKGNLHQAAHQLAVSYQHRPEWTVLDGLPLSALDAAHAPLLELESFPSETTFDALNRPVTQTLPDGTEIHPEYNAAGVLEAMNARLRGAPTLTSFVTNIEYDAKGQRDRIVYQNGAVTTYTYDPLTLRLRRLNTLRNAEPLQDLSYTYDPAGNITDIADDAQQTLFFAGQVVTPTAQYRYDATYQLVCATGREHASLGPQPDQVDPIAAQLPHPNDGQAVRRYTQTYVYDEVGNVLTMKHAAGPTGSWTRQYSYDASSNRLLAHSLPGDPAGTFSATFHHDVHGSMTRMPHLAELSWDFEDQFCAVDLGGGGHAYYTYDAAGRRVRKVIERLGGRTEERIYLGGFELYRKSSSGAVDFERETVHITDDTRLIALIETTTADDNVPPGYPPEVRTRYHLGNHLGSCSLELDQNSAVISYEEYHPYGTTSLWLGAPASEVSERRYRYTGKEKDDETALYYHGARYYAPWLARWTAADPAGLADGSNLYAYVRENPVKFVDPNGTDSTSSCHGGSRRDDKYVLQASPSLAPSLSPEQMLDLLPSVRDAAQAAAHNKEIATHVTIAAIAQQEAADPRPPVCPNGTCHGLRGLRGAGMSKETADASAMQAISALAGIVGVVSIGGAIAEVGVAATARAFIVGETANVVGRGAARSMGASENVADAVGFAASVLATAATFSAPRRSTSTSRSLSGSTILPELLEYNPFAIKENMEAWEILARNAPGSAHIFEVGKDLSGLNELTFFGHGVARDMAALKAGLTGAERVVIEGIGEVGPYTFAQTLYDNGFRGEFLRIMSCGAGLCNVDTGLVFSEQVSKALGEFGVSTATAGMKGLGQVGIDGILAEKLGMKATLASVVTIGPAAGKEGVSIFTYSLWGK